MAENAPNLGEAPMNPRRTIPAVFRRRRRMRLMRTLERKRKAAVAAQRMRDPLVGLYIEFPAQES